MNKTNDIFFNRYKEKETLDNLLSKFESSYNSYPTSYLSYLDVKYLYSEIVYNMINKLDFLVVNTPAFRLYYNEHHNSKGTQLVYCDNSVQTDVFENYETAINELLKYMSLEGNVDKYLAIYHIDINLQHGNYGTVNDIYKYKNVYPVMVRYIFVKLDDNNHIFGDYLKIKKRKDIAEYYKNLNSKYLTFKEYIKKEGKNYILLNSI